MNRSALFVFAVFLNLVAAYGSDQRERVITPVQAKALVLASLTPGEKRLPGLGADRFDDPHSSQFWFFTVTWASGPDQSVVVANYAVDPHTGDVWSAVIECHEETNQTLRTLQAHVRSSLGLSHSEYMRLRTTGPLCEK
jgi:hypothetical protein